jgi:dynein heavy chain
MAELKQQYDEKLAQKEELKRKAEYTELMLERATKLMSGLAGEKERWQETVKVRGQPNSCHGQSNSCQGQPN